jgi:phage terminase large subunit-like protein
MTRSADEPERLRGPQFTKFWADELCAWRFVQEAWDQIMFGFRLPTGRLRGIITTTPKPIKVFTSLLKNPETVVTSGTSYENRANLSDAYYQGVIAPYEGTRLGRQEILGEVLEDRPGALWKRNMIDAARIRSVDIRWDLITRVVVAIDPGVSNNPTSDPTGIVVAARTLSGHGLVLDDLTTKDTPLGWARIAIAAMFARKADRIVAERNNGGDLVEANLRAVNPDIPYRSVWASRGKLTRAEPVAALYEQGRIHHAGSFASLEDEMCDWEPGQPSPNRMDALVWAFTELFGLDGEERKGHVVFSSQYQISPI